MANLIYSAITSLDGYVADENGNFEWGEPDEEVHSFINDFQRSIGTHLYGRRLYDVMIAWEKLDPVGQPPYMQEFAQIWQAAEKVVYSKTLESVATANTRLERHFDPEAIRAMKASARRDLLVGGPTLAAHAFGAGLIDECHLYLAPIVVGGGKRSLPDGVRSSLDLVNERRFGNGMVHLHYRRLA